jgi:phosphoribosylaminoimidazole carboxylase PurE protein
MNNYVDKIAGPVVVIMAGSDSDIPHIEKIRAALKNYGIFSQVRICSAHKQAGELVQVLKEYNDCEFPVLIVAVAGGTDALSGTASFHSVFPVVSCPPDGMNETCLTNPPGSSNAFIKRPDNVAKFAAQMFSCHDATLKAKIVSVNREKIKQLERADFDLNTQVAPETDQQLNYRGSNK